MKRWRLAGVLSGVAGLAAGELAAVFVRPDSSPYIAVGDAVVDLTPAAVKELAIGWFGAAGKLLLLVGIGLLLVVAAGWIGELARTRSGFALSGVCGFGGVGVLAAATRPDAGVADVVPALLATVTAAAVLRGMAGLLHDIDATAPRAEPVVDGTEPVAGGAQAGGADGEGRRRFLLAGGLVGVASVAGYALSRWLAVSRFGAERSRAGVTVPSPVSRAAGAPRDPAVDIEGLSRFHTPNQGFYQVHTALRIPQIAAEDWKLRVHGMVERELTVTYQELLDRPMIERDITLACVSNPVGGPYVGNARWIGVPLKELLAEVGVRAGADQAVSRSHDGMTIGTPTAALTDGRDAILAVAMNGEPLPVEHGFPVRMVVPGLYGYVSACKWIVDLELTTFDAYDAYWVKQGWAERAEIKTASRIDTPADGATADRGIVTVAGVAWAQHRGIDRVEVRVDDGAWREAELAEETTVDTWRQWYLRWRAEPGEHRIQVRATDGDGQPQTAARHKSFPDGATGWHEINVTVRG